jgi:predicted subunit of tRNA(5-methylaminomethyl-2-thiouridylate) methyltransferase
MFFWGTPKHKVYAEYDGKSREELIDAILVAEEQKVKDDKNLQKTIDLYEERAAKQAKKVKEDAEDLAREVSQRESDTMREHKIELDALNLEHETAFEVQAKEYEIKLADAELKMKYDDKQKVTDAQTAQYEAEKELAVAEAKVEMLEEMINLNGDIVDIKDMTNKIIDKLPSMSLNLTSLPSAPAQKSNKENKD